MKDGRACEWQAIGNHRSTLQWYNSDPNMHCRDALNQALGYSPNMKRLCCIWLIPIYEYNLQHRFIFYFNHWAGPQISKEATDIKKAKVHTMPPHFAQLLHFLVLSKCENLGGNLCKWKIYVKQALWMVQRSYGANILFSIL